MKKSLAHLPKEKQTELMLITEKIREIVPQAEMIVLFGSYARGDWVDGPHVQGRGKLTIHKKSDYDILVITQFKFTAKDTVLWDKVKTELAKLALSTIARIIPRDIDFINSKLSHGQYFFTEIIEDGTILYDSGKFELCRRMPLNPSDERQIAQENLDEVFTKAKYFYDDFLSNIVKSRYKQAAFMLHQSAEFSYKTVLLVFGGECPQEHHLDVLADSTADYVPDLVWILPRVTEDQKKLFELLDYAYIGARYDINYKITKKQLEQLSPCVKKLHEVTERICKEKIKSFA